MKGAWNIGNDDLTSLTVGQFYPQTPEAVWQALLSDEFIFADWILSVDGAGGGRQSLKAGAKFRVKAYPIPGTGYSGNAECELLEVAPGRVLSFSYTSIDGEARWPTYVTWSFHPEPGGTRLLYVQSGFDPSNPAHAHTRRVLERGATTMLVTLEKIRERRGQS